MQYTEVYGSAQQDELDGTIGRERAIWKGAVAGLAGGLVAAWTMNQFQTGLTKLSESDSSAKDQSQEQQKEGDDATVKAASAVSENVAGHRLTPEEKNVAGPIVHYAFGAAMGALYGASAELAPATSRAWGLPFGAALWLAADEIGVPLARLSPPPNEVPASTHASALAAHLVYGATTDTVRRMLLAAMV